MVKMNALRTVHTFRDYGFDGDEMVSALDVSNDPDDGTRLTVTVSDVNGTAVTHSLTRHEVVRLAHFLNLATDAS